MPGALGPGAVARRGRRETPPPRMTIAKLNQLEAAGDWNAALSFAKAHQGEDPKILARLVFYGWYLPLEGDFLAGCSGKARALASRQLAELLPAAKASSAPAVLLEVGYGMGQVAFMFPGGPQTVEAEARAILERAYVLSGEDPLHGVVLRGAGGTARVRIAPADWQTLLQERFAGPGEYNRYWLGVLADRVPG